MSCPHVTPSCVLGVVLATFSSSLLPQPARAQETPAIPVNELKGLVVNAADGRPVAEASVVLADREDGWIWFGQDGRLQADGPEDRVLFFFKKTNGLSACTAQTDAEGRFTFQRFRSPSKAYTVAAVHATAGVKLMARVIPDQVKDGLLRIELEPAAYIEGPTPPAGWRDASQREFDMYRVSLDADPDPARDDVAGSGVPSEFGNIFFDVTRWSPDGQIAAPSGRLGPLPGGFRYRLNLQHYSSRTGAPATLFEKVVSVKPGETARALPEAAGASVSGIVSTSDGTPLRDVNVTASVGADRHTVLGAITDEKGAYTIAGLPPGTHKLQLDRFAIRTAPG